jgi:hypothetical protein
MGYNPTCQKVRPSTICRFCISQTHKICSGRNKGVGQRPDLTLREAVNLHFREVVVSFATDDSHRLAPVTLAGLQSESGQALAVSMVF